MRIGVLRETRDGERRVALTPEGVRKALALGAGAEGGGDVQVLIERGAGLGSAVSDEQFQEAGAALVEAHDALGADVVVCVNAPAPDRAGSLRAGAVLIGLLNPTGSTETVETLRERAVSALAFEAVPRITRAQKMDALSAMSTIAGYRAALHGAMACPRFWPMLMTAAGTITAARVLVLGAGVAGLQAIATARRLGAVVEAYDIRAAAKEQVLSLGARFVELASNDTDAETAGGYAKEQSAEAQARQRELLTRHIAGADVVITTALVPGRPAPRLIEADQVRAMKPGAVVVDLAAEAGGNCALTQPGERVEEQGVVILGPLNLPSELPVDASRMYGRNVVALLEELAPQGRVDVDLDNEVIAGALITHQGDVMHAPTREVMGLPPLERAEVSS